MAIEARARLLDLGGAETDWADRGGGAERAGAGLLAGALRTAAGCRRDTGIVVDAGARTATPPSGSR